jgi:hypothetical protein
MLSRFGLFVRNRRDEELGYSEDEVELPKHGEGKPYPYLLVIRALFYAFLASAIVCKSLIDFLLANFE